MAFRFVDGGLLFALRAGDGGFSFTGGDVDLLLTTALRGGDQGTLAALCGDLRLHGVQDFGGDITISDAPVARDLQLSYAGALSGAGQVLAVSGTMAGVFLGDPVRALSASDLDPSLSLNGVTRTGTLVLVAEQAAP